LVISPELTGTDGRPQTLTLSDDNRYDMRPTSSAFEGANENRPLASVPPAIGLEIHLMRVLFVSPVGELGGGEQVLLEIAARAKELGVTPMFACMRPGALTDIARRRGIEAAEYRDHRYRHLPAVFGAVRWLTEVARQFRADLLHVNHAAHIYSSFAARKLGLPEVWHLHDYPYRRDWLDILNQRLRTSYVIFTTEKVRSGYPGLCRGPNSVIHPICVDPKLLQACIVEPGVRLRYGLPFGPLLLTVARLQLHKGHKDLIAAAPHILREQPDAVFAIAGKAGTPEQETYLKELQAYAHQLGVAEKIRFLGFIGENDLVALYREAAALVHPARSEGFGLTLLEAMSLGLPVIAAAADGPSAIIENGKNGLLFAPGNPDALSTSVVRVLKDPLLASALRAGGTAWSQLSNVDRMVESTVEVYRTLVVPNEIAMPNV
jgi:glycosyltransferase involved in cell wall biosynthesis